MGFNYSAAALDQPLNEIRLEIQDTNETEALFQDEEINFIFSREKSVLKTCARLCRAAAAKFSREEKLDDGTIKYDPEARAKTYLKLAADYDAKAALEEKNLESVEQSTGGVFFPTLPDDSAPAFTRNLHLS